MTPEQERNGVCSILGCAAFIIGAIQIENYLHPFPEHHIKQRMVQVIEISPNHPPREYVILENVSDDSN